MSETLKAEHERLLLQTRELQQEHDRLSREAIVDFPAHQRHRERLWQKVRELREHMKRIQEQPPRAPQSSRGR